MTEKDSAFVEISRNLYFKSQDFFYSNFDKKMYYMQDAIYNQNCEVMRLLKIIAIKTLTKNTETLEKLDGPETNLEDFLDWIADRMVNVYHEPPNVDFVLSLRKRAETARKIRNG